MTTTKKSPNAAAKISTFTLIKKKTTKKPAPKKETTKTPAKKAARKVTAPKSGLSKQQVKILEVLEPGKGFTKKQIIAKGVEATSFGGQAGLRDPEKRAARDAVKGASLLTLKFVRVEEQGAQGKEVAVWFVTAAGKSILEKKNRVA